MMKRLLLVALLVLAGCGSSNQPPAKENTKSNPPGKEGNRAERRPAPAPKADNPNNIDGNQYMDPPADVVAGMGVDVYPGARMLKAMQGVKGTTEDISYRDLIFFTHDPASKVAEFYKTHLPEAKSVGEIMQSMNVYALDGKNAAGDSVRVQAQGTKDLTHIHIIIRKSK